MTQREITFDSTDLEQLLQRQFPQADRSWGQADGALYAIRANWSSMVDTAELEERYAVQMFEGVLADDSRDGVSYVLKRFNRGGSPLDHFRLIQPSDEKVDLAHRLTRAFAEFEFDEKSPREFISATEFARKYESTQTGPSNIEVMKPVVADYVARFFSQGLSDQTLEFGTEIVQIAKQFAVESETEVRNAVLKYGIALADNVDHPLDKIRVNNFMEAASESGLPAPVRLLSNEEVRFLTIADKYRKNQSIHPDKVESDHKRAALLMDVAEFKQGTAYTSRLLRLLWSRGSSEGDILNEISQMVGKDDDLFNMSLYFLAGQAGYFTSFQYEPIDLTQHQSFVQGANRMGIQVDQQLVRELVPHMIKLGYVEVVHDGIAGIGDIQPQDYNLAIVHAQKAVEDAAKAGPHQRNRTANVYFAQLRLKALTAYQTHGFREFAIPSDISFGSGDSATFEFRGQQFTRTYSTGFKGDNALRRRFNQELDARGYRGRRERISQIDRRR